MKNNKITLSEIQGMALITLLLLLNYGLVWSRGGYLDDFVFLAYTEKNDLFTAISHWSFNSRLTQGLFLPLLLKALSGDQAGEFYWWIFHGLSLFLVTTSMLLLNGILKQLQAPWVMRFTACLFFVLYPIKNSTIMWPATIVGYVISLTLFLIGTYLYFSKAKTDSETFLSLLFVWVFYLLAIFSIEQLFPLVLLVILLRLYLWRSKKTTLILHTFGALSLVVLFISVNFFGKTAVKVSRYSMDNSSLVEHALQVSVQSLLRFFESPLRILLDPYYWDALQIAGSQLLFFLCVLTLCVTGWFFINLERNKEMTTPKNTLFFFTGGIVLWFSALSPLMVVSYALPNRIFFMPLIGFSISIAAIVNLLDDKFRLFRYFAAPAILLTGTVFSLINLYTQNNFAQKWENETILIDTLKRIKQDISSNKTIQLFNFPEDFGPGPNMRDFFTFNGMVNWLYPNKNLSGITLGNFDEALQLPYEIPYHNNRKNTVYYPQTNNLILLWSNNKNGLINVKELRLGNSLEQHSLGESSVTENAAYVIDGILTPLEHSIKEKKYTIKIPYLIKLNEHNLGVLRIALTDINYPVTNHKLRIHVNYKNGTTLPHDKFVFDSKNTWLTRGADLYTSVFLNNLTEIDSIAVFSDNNKNSGSTLRL